MRTLLLIVSSTLWTTLSSAQSFPERCLGTWTGMMEILAKGKLVDQVNVRFTVAELETKGRYTWKTEYLSETMPVTKDYVLIADSTNENSFILDEGEGVLLPQFVFGNKMYSLFSVGKIMLTAYYEFVGEYLVFEVTSGTRSKIKSKGGVKNYTVDTVQRVQLSRIS